MLVFKTQQELKMLCQTLCQEYNLQSFYLAQIIGKRRHFLAGSGVECFSGVNRLNITEGITMFWQGRLTEIKAKLLAYQLVPLARRIEKELQCFVTPDIED